MLPSALRELFFLWWSLAHLLCLGEQTVQMQADGLGWSAACLPSEPFLTRFLFCSLCLQVEWGLTLVGCFPGCSVSSLPSRFAQWEALVGDKRARGREKPGYLSLSLSICHISGARCFFVALARQVTMVLTSTK